MGSPSFVCMMTFGPCGAPGFFGGWGRGGWGGCMLPLWNESLFSGLPGKNLRCIRGHHEDGLHCIWGCEISKQCWRLGEFLLESVATTGHSDIRLTPAQIFIAEPLPVEWKIPGKFWHVVRAILCWQI